MTKKKTDAAARVFSAQEWRDIYDALVDSASMHHSGPRAERMIALARKVREEVLP